MPVVHILRNQLFAAMGRSYTDEEFDQLCFEFGIELDEVTSERQIVANEQGEEAARGLSNETIYKIEVPANRCDLLCVEGISRSLRIFLGMDRTPEFTVVRPPAGKMHRIVVKAETQRIRPFVVSAILRGVTFDEHRYESFLDLQDKLHWNICRRRTLTAIGTHDLDKLRGPFTYEALPPSHIEFQPLNEDRVFNAEQLFHYYREEKKQCTLKPFLHILDGSPVFPVIYDSQRTVCSLPPIINGEHSKITLETRNVFIECTATDHRKAEIVLCTLIAMFSQYCEQPFSVEAVEVVYEDGFPTCVAPNVYQGTGQQESHVYPSMDPTVFEPSVDYITDGIGVHIGPQRIVEMLNRMQLPATYRPETRTMRVLAPVTRSDVLHACDIQEDVAIAYGYNNIQRSVAASATVGRQQPINKLSDLVREVVAQAGFTEVLTWALVSRRENFQYLRRKDDDSAVVLANPASEEFEIVRTTLLSGILKVLASNMGHVSLPVRLFEVSDVALLDSTRDVGSRNARRLVACHCAPSSEFEVIHGLLDRVMQQNEFCFEEDARESKERVDPKRVYSIKPSEDEAFFPDHRADIWVNGAKVGVFGIVHPEVLKHFKIDFPVTALELDLEIFL